MTSRSLAYTVSAPRSAQHLLHVSLVVAGDLPEPLEVAMPAWTPGSYLVREYARHVEGLRASSASAPCGVRKLAKDRWAIAHGGADTVTIEYDVYANDLTVRTNHADDSHAYWNGAATYVRPVQDGAAWDAVSPTLSVVVPNPEWHVACTLDPTGAPNTFRAADFDALVDHPVDMGRHEVLEFTVRDVPHSIVVWGTRSRFDRARLVKDVSTIVETEAAMFGGLPYARYMFLTHLAPGGRGGLEHRDCCTLLVSADAFDSPDEYDDVLSLFAHEFFHLWHVKRTRPAGLVPYDYRGENYTRMLWLFEGGTSYYDWLILRRAGLVDARGYLKHLASEIARLEETPGRFGQTLEEASFDAWIKLYRPDEHSVNSTVSYYLKGEVVCALLDLEIRSRTDGAKSLDDVLRYVWNEYGAKEIGVPEERVEAVFAAATGVDVSDALDAMVRTTQPLPYDRVFALAGLTVKPRPGRGASLGVRVRSEGGRAVIASVLRGGAAERAGLSAGDEVIAIDGRRVDDAGLRERLRTRQSGHEVDVLYARREQIGNTRVTLGEAPPKDWFIAGDPDAAAASRALGEAWLGNGGAALWTAR